MPRLSSAYVAILLAALTTACSGSGGHDGPTDPPDTNTTVGTVLVTPPSQTIVQGSTTTFTAQARSAAGVTIAGKSFTWTSSNSVVATVANGVVTAVSAGAALVTATVDGVSGNASVTVTALPVTRLTITPTSLNLIVGQTNPLTVTTYNGNTVLTGRVVAYSSNNSTVASVSTSGVVTAINAGTARITATSEGISAQVDLTVTYTQAVFSQITLGDFHTCALNAAGAAFCWGHNLQGQSGTGSSQGHSVPTAVSGGRTFTQISAGNAHTCAVTSTGAAWCWGMNVWAQLGDGTTTQRNTPVAVQGGHLFQSIAAGQFFTCALTTTGQAYCWGQGMSGQLGTGTETNASIPAPVAGGLTFVSLSASETGACGLTAGGRAYCWGAAPSHGDGTAANRTSPVEVAGNRIYKHLIAGGRGGCAITTNDVSYCWGTQGTIAGVTTITTPWQMTTAIPFARFAPTQRATCSITTAQAVYCWGLNDHGQIGDSTRTNRDTPTRLYGSIAFSKIATGGWHACGLEPNGKAWCWGSNDFMELGTGLQYQGQGLVPVPVRSP